MMDCVQEYMAVKQSIYEIVTVSKMLMENYIIIKSCKNSEPLVTK